MEYHCEKCDMRVKVACGKCGAGLVKDLITTPHHQKVEVAKCPKGCGMIKSPVCCAKDMVCTH